MKRNGNNMFTLRELKESYKLPIEEQRKFYNQKFNEVKRFAYPKYRNRKFAKFGTDSHKEDALYSGIFIIKDIIRCLLMPEDPDTVNLWMDDIVERINSSSWTGYYTWVFRPYRKYSNRYTKKEIKRFIRLIKSEKDRNGGVKYPNLNYNEFDIKLINDTLLNIEKTLTRKKTRNLFYSDNRAKRLINKCLPKQKKLKGELYVAYYR